MTFLPDTPEETGPLTTGCGHPRGTESTDSNHVLVDSPEFVTQSGDDYVPPLVASDSAAVGNTQDGKVVGVAVDGPIPFRKGKRAQSDTDDETWVADGDANTLTAFDMGDTRTTHAVVEPLPTYGMYGAGVEGAMRDTQRAVTASHGQPGNVAMPLGDLAEQEGLAFDGWNQNLDVGVHRSLRTSMDAADFVADPGGMRYGVRRLTPVECERLQSFPDGWTEPAGSDSARYKALGNAVTVNTVGWILRRISEVEALGLDDEREDDSEHR